MLLAVRDELALSRIRADVAAAGLRAAPFFEPDLGGALTAIAVEPDGRRFLARLSLALTTSASSHRPATSSHREEVRHGHHW